jgi:hypothetical protein
MSNLACYTSNGRIRELILFDKESYAIPEGMTPGEKIDSVLAYYMPFVERLNEKDVQVKLYVLFDVTEPELWQRTDAAEGKLTLLPVNSLVPGANISTPWTQDVIHILHGEEKGEVVIRVDIDRVSPELFEVLSSELPGNWELADCSTLPPGGNCLRIESFGTEICIVNKDMNEDNPGIFTAENIPGSLEVFPGNYHVVDLGKLDKDYCSPVFKRVVYHVDQYITPVGRLTNGSPYLFFVPEVLPAKFVPEKSGDTSCMVKLGKQIAEIKEIVEEIVGPVNCETLPLFVLDFEKNPFGLCYNNCLVEHYLLNGERKAIIYFPDYREPVKKQLEGAALSDKVMEGINAIVDYAGITNDMTGLTPGGQKGLKVLRDYFSWQNELATHGFPAGVFSAGDIAGTAVEKKAAAAQTSTKKMKSLTEYFTDNAFQDAFNLLGNVIELTEASIERVQSGIREKLAAMGIQSHFIALDFRNDAERLGGLHCRIKVISRDCDL